jgi:hypothetical protein
MSFDDPFASVEPQQPKKTARSDKKKDKFDRPLDVSRRDAYKATGTGGSVMHGEYYQLTTRLPVEIVEQVREWATDLKMTQQDLQRYCFYRGLQALSEGERPEVEEVVVRKKLKPPE